VHESIQNILPSSHAHRKTPTVTAQFLLENYQLYSHSHLQLKAMLGLGRKPPPTTTVMQTKVTKNVITVKPKS
jgi:hypothetical protein